MSYSVSVSEFSAQHARGRGSETRRGLLAAEGVGAPYTGIPRVYAPRKRCRGRRRGSLPRRTVTASGPRRAAWVAASESARRELVRTAVRGAAWKGGGLPRRRGGVKGRVLEGGVWPRRLERLR
jgi:hypothetical protein